MWYVIWPSIGLACGLGILDATWFEAHPNAGRDRAAVINGHWRPIPAVG